jgi:transposase-like protein/transposase
MFKTKYNITVSPEDVSELTRIINSPTAARRAVQRARIVLECAAGHAVAQVARTVGVSPPTVCFWRKRFWQSGIPGLAEKARTGRKRRITKATAQQIVDRAVKGEGRASSRKVAREVGVSKNTVQRIWREHDLKPHLLRTFKLSNDKHFEEKFWDVVGLYLDPPEHAIVLCCDEKSQCQALERTQPGLPLGTGHIRTRTHDYYRHGTITLFAALDYLSGKIISRTEKRHRHTEWLRFMRQIDREVAKPTEIHIILDNYCTHKHKKVKEWLAKHPRFHLHFTPTSASWMNLVERFFRDISEDVIRAGSFTSVAELTDSIIRYLAERNTAPRRYVWRADGNEILEKILRARARLEAMAHV